MTLIKPAPGASAGRTVPAFDADSEEFRALLETLRQEAGERDRHRLNPIEHIRHLARLGFGAARIPRAHGGGGMGIATLYGLVFEIATAEPNIAHTFRNHFAFVEGCIRPDLIGGNTVWIERMTGGALVGGSFHEHGSHAAGTSSFATTIRPVEGGFVINGDKAYSTGNLYVDWLTVAAGDPDGKAVSAAIPADREGIEHLDDWDGIGQRLSGSGTTRYTNVFVYPEEIIEGPRNIRVKPYGSTFNQLWLTTVIAGIVQAAVHDTVEFVKKRRRNYYHGLAPLPRDDTGVQQSLGELAANAYVIEATVRDAAAALEKSWESGGGVDVDVSLAHAAALKALKAKIVIDEMAQRTASLLFDVGGATSVTEKTNLDRHWRNIRTLAAHNPRGYKARYLGDYLLNGTELPNSSYF